MHGRAVDVLRDCVRDLRPPCSAGFEVRFETPPGQQAQVDFAHFEVEFADEPGVRRIVWLFSMVLGFSRLIWGRFVVHQDLQSVLRCHIAALEAIGGAPHEILYDRMKTAVIGEDADGLVVYNRALVDLARHYGFQPRACRPYRPKTKGKVERPFRYIREDFFLGGSFRNLDDLNAEILGSYMEKALAAGKSLLPAGVARVEGAFDRGDAVIIRSADGRELGRGLIAYAKADAERIIGRKSSEIAPILGVSRCDELIHRDDMALNRT